MNLTKFILLKKIFAERNVANEKVGLYPKHHAVEYTETCAFVSASLVPLGASNFVIIFFHKSTNRTQGEGGG